jgi:hypothetical protein
MKWHMYREHKEVGLKYQGAEIEHDEMERLADYLDTIPRLAERE